MAVSSARLNRTLSGIREGWKPYRDDPAVNRAEELLSGLTYSRQGGRAQWS
jgi:hypothetical protein